MAKRTGKSDESHTRLIVEESDELRRVGYCEYAFTNLLFGGDDPLLSKVCSSDSVRETR